MPKALSPSSVKCVLAAMAAAVLFATVAHAQIEVTPDVPYKDVAASSEYEKSRCKLDIYRPVGPADLPCLVWFHGGALQEGEKSNQTTKAVCRALAGEGFVVAAVSYRLSPKALFPAYIEDAAASVAWMEKHAPEFGGDSKRVFVAGHSAGGYLAAMVALDARFLAKFGSSPDRLAGVIPIAGQMATHYTIREERGVPKTRIIVDEAAPLYHARKGTAPMLVLYAEKDMVLREEENRYFAAAMAAAGNNGVTLKEVAGHDHGGVGDRIAEENSPVRALIKEFVGKINPAAAAPQSVDAAPAK